MDTFPCDVFILRFVFCAVVFHLHRFNRKKTRYSGEDVASCSMFKCQGRTMTMTLDYSSNFMFDLPRGTMRGCKNNVFCSKIKSARHDPVGGSECSCHQRLLGDALIVIVRHAFFSLRFSKHVERRLV